MANLKVGLDKKSIIILSVIFFLVLGGGGYLLWRVNQAKTVAPTDSSASESTGGMHTVSLGVGYRGMGGFKVEGQDGIREKVELEVKDGEDAPKITVTPAKGYVFDGWGQSGKDKHETVIELKNVKHSYRYPPALFAPSSEPPVNPPVVTSITLTYKAGAGGKVSKEDEPNRKTVTFNLKKGGSGTQVLAQADRGYKFKSWSVKADAGEKETEKKPWSTAIIGASQGGDGTREKRIDKEVKTSITVTAVFTKSCGDKKCDTWESEDKNCPADCEGCGDGVCTPPENPATCFEDCRSSSKFCGDGTCSENENEENCPADCKEDIPVETPDSPVCGDGVCNGDESMETCPADCDIPPVEGETVPETGIFDDTRNVVMMGVVLFGLGIGWTRISKTYGKLVQRRKENFEKRVVEG